MFVYKFKSLQIYNMQQKICFSSFVYKVENMMKLIDSDDHQTI